MTKEERKIVEEELEHSMKIATLIALETLLEMMDKYGKVILTRNDIVELVKTQKEII